MPTTHVEPGSESLLQEIANSLGKARKVVVITGAGISTNSGIPDFRSENGLYSLIQAQFEALEKQGAASNSVVDLPDPALEPRPEKRLRTSRADPPESETTLFPGLRKETSAKHEQGSRGGVEEPPGSARDLSLAHSPNRTGIPSNASNPRRHVSVAERDTAARDPDSMAEPPLTPLPSPRLAADQIEVASVPTREDRGAPFASSPPSPFLSALRRPGLTDLQTRSSSPLSSPPPVLFDPYQESLRETSSSASSRDSASTRSQSEEPSSVSTPLLTSQTFFASSSGRSSLPNMKGRDLFDSQIWSCPRRTSVFYTFATTLRQKVRLAEPTSSHRFVSVLRDSRKLVRCYTQNIDQLEERVGLTTSLALGPGSRYRFSARAGRRPEGPRSSLKAADSSVDGSFMASQAEEDQQGETQSLEKVQPSQAECQDSLSINAQLSQPDSEPASTQNDIPNPSVPPIPNRGVECVYLHGSLAELRCFVCARTASWDEEARLADTLAGRQPTCPHCAGATAAREEKGKRALGVGKLRPDIVLYGEEHPQAHLISPLVQHDLSLGPDMLLILGTSLRVHGLKVLVREFAKAVHDRGGKVVFVNFTKPPESVWADVIDFWVQWDCDAWVGDLEARKPALWRPPGTAIPDEEKPKPVKRPRRPCGEPATRRARVDKPSKGGRESGISTCSQERDDSGVWAAREQANDRRIMQSHEMPPPALPPAGAVPKRRATVTKERKLNPNAKRPASVRDHKKNGAYMVWKILQDLRRITGGDPSSPPAPSPSEPATRSKPRPKRPRKSAPAAIEVKTEKYITIDAVRPGPTGTAGASSPVPSRPPGTTVEPAIANGGSSISAAVKSRKRKQAVTWRMINGVETRVSLHDQQDEAPPQPLPHTPAVFELRPPRLPLPQPQPYNFKALPPPTPTAPLPAAPPPQPPLQSGYTPATASINPFTAGNIIDDSFRETDRLVAQLHQESAAVFIPRSSTSRPSSSFRLAALNIPPAGGRIPHNTGPGPGPRETSPPKLEPLEPKVSSPGPQATIACDVGSPVSSSRAAMGANTTGSNPFFFADPLAGWLQCPPWWTEQRQRQQQQQQDGNRHWGNGCGRELHAHTHEGEGGYGPDEQLRKEQEAALMLSAMRGGSCG